jgi:hypothetical protein
MKSDFALDAVMLSLSKHLKEYLNRPFDRLSITDSNRVVVIARNEDNRTK